MDRQGRKGLSRSLREPYIGERWLRSGRQYVVDAVRDIVKCELVNGEVPKIV